MIPRRKSNALNSYVYYTNQVNRYFTPVEPQNTLPIVDILREKENTWYLGFNGNAYNLNQNGNIGIGTTTPEYKLDVQGTTRVTGDLIVDGMMYNVAGVPNNVPVGSIMAYVGEIQYGSFGQDPEGWMVCDGRQLPPNGIYVNLFNLIRYTYGYGNEEPDASGNLIRKFLLPNYRGAFLRGSGDNTQNQMYDSESPVDYFGPPLNKYQDSSIESHTHGYQDVYLTTLSAGGMLKYTPLAASTSGGATSGILNSTTNTNNAKTGATFTTNETRPYCYGINWIIKL